MSDVFLVQHVRGDDDERDIKTIGVFGDTALARQAIEQLRDLPGFRDWPDGFSIDAYELNRCWWTSGFGVGESDDTRGDQSSVGINGSVDSDSVGAPTSTPQANSDVRQTLEASERDAETHGQ